jgi:hypothetical protein
MPLLKTHEKHASNYIPKHEGAAQADHNENSTTVPLLVVGLDGVLDASSSTQRRGA